MDAILELKKANIKLYSETIELQKAVESERKLNACYEKVLLETLNLLGGAEYFREVFKESEYSDWQAFCDGYCPFSDACKFDCFVQEQEARCNELGCAGCRNEQCCDDAGVTFEQKRFMELQDDRRRIGDV